MHAVVVIVDGCAVQNTPFGRGHAPIEIVYHQIVLYDSPTKSSRSLSDFGLSEVPLSSRGL